MWSLKGTGLYSGMITGKQRRRNVHTIYSESGSEDINTRMADDLPWSGIRNQGRSLLCYVNYSGISCLLETGHDVFADHNQLPVLVEDFQSLCYKASVRMLWIFAFFF